MNEKGIKLWGPVLCIAAFDLILWHGILAEQADPGTQIQFFDVGQGDAALMTLDGHATIMIDAGEGQLLEKIFSSQEKRDDVGIDVAIATHPELDHFGGFESIFSKYDIGVFVINGRKPTGKGSEEKWNRLMNIAKGKGIPIVTLGKGSRIRYGKDVLNILSPGPEVIGGGNLNETSIVVKLETSDLTALFTGDIGEHVERFLAGMFDLRSDILKVAHHGSKYSSAEKFLEAVHPALAVISLGRHNKYGHPSSETLKRLEDTGSLILRTDINGSIRVFREGSHINAAVEREGGKM